MMKFLALVLLAAASAPLPPAPARALVAQAPAAAPAQAPGPVEFAQLEIAFGSSLQEWRKKLEALKKADPAATAPPHPAIEFLPKFESLLERGEPRALLWIGAWLGDGRPQLAKEDALAQRWKCYERVVDEHSDAAWIRDFTRSLTSIYFTFGAERVDPLVERFTGRSKDKEAVAEALYRCAAEAKNKKQDQRAEALLARLGKELPETEYGRRARGIKGAAAVIGEAKPGLNVGNLAPEFTAKDADGVEFKLSDYRGKVVVLDFWGFW